MITSFMPLRRWSGRVRIPLAYLFPGSRGRPGSIMLRKLPRPRPCRGAAFLNRGRRPGHPSIWLRGAALYCVTLAVQSIQPGLLANLVKTLTLSTPNPHRLPSKVAREDEHLLEGRRCGLDRKSTRLNSSHTVISYAVFCLKKKKSRRLPEDDTPTSDRGD